MKKHNTREIRNTVGALDFANVAAKEIAERLGAGTAGLPYKVPISVRQVYNYRRAYREEHGLPERDQVSDPTADSFAALRQRIVAIVRREIAFYEGRRTGKATAKDLAMLKRLHATLYEWERREATATGKLRTNQVPPSDRPQKDAQPESAIQALARAERERKAEAATESIEEQAARIAAELGSPAAA